MPPWVGNWISKGRECPIVKHSYCQRNGPPKLQNNHCPFLLVYSRTQCSSPLSHRHHVSSERKRNLCGNMLCINIMYLTSDEVFCHISNGWTLYAPNLLSCCTYLSSLHVVEPICTHLSSCCMVGAIYSLINNSVQFISNMARKILW
jgi:hypothetical protein